MLNLNNSKIFLIIFLVTFLILINLNCLSFGNNMKLEIGSKAPDFHLTDQYGKTHSLSDYKGSFVALYFYPKDNTPGCTQEACSIRDSYQELKDNNIVVLGINNDSLNSHKSFSDKFSLQFPLLSDTDKSITKAYGANRLLFSLPKRKTFIIDPNGNIFKIIDKVNTKTHAQDILNLIKTMS